MHQPPVKKCCQIGYVGQMAWSVRMETGWLGWQGWLVASLSHSGPGGGGYPGLWGSWINIQVVETSPISGKFWPSSRLEQSKIA